MHRGVVVIALVAGLAAPAQAVEFELKNDGFVDGGEVAFQLGFVAGEVGAVRMTPPGAGPYTLTRVQFLFGGSTDVQTITLKIYADGTGATPGAELFSNDYSLLGADESMQEINLAGEGITVTGPFRVGIQFQHSGLPSIGRDNDGISATQNYIFGSGGVGWVQSTFFGVSGDWIIRTFVEDGMAPGTPDASPPGTPDASPPGTPDSGPAGGDCVSDGDCAVGQYCNELNACSFDCREDGDCGDEMACNSLGMCVAAEGDGGGCGCRTGNRAGGGAGPLMMMLLLGVLRRRSGRTGR